MREVSIDLSKKADSSQDCEEGGGGRKDRQRDFKGKLKLIEGGCYNYYYFLRRELLDFIIIGPLTCSEEILRWRISRSDSADLLFLLLTSPVSARKEDGPHFIIIWLQAKVSRMIARCPIFWGEIGIFCY